MVYLFSEAGLAALRRFIDPSILFAFDLDGTLAPIVDDPRCIRVSPTIRRELAVLKERAVVAVITGRSRTDALGHLGVVPHYLVGNHGAEGLPGWEAREREFRTMVAIWERQLCKMFPDAKEKGIVIENKGVSLSLHYRGARDTTGTHSLLLSGIASLIPRPRRMGGKYVENLLPESAPDKGIAIRRIMQEAGCASGFFAGDDVTDEEIFRMPGDRLFGVRVGWRSESRAPYYLRDQQEMAPLLHYINDIIAGQK